MKKIIKSKTNSINPALISGFGYALVYGFIVVLQQYFVRATLHPLQLNFFAYLCAFIVLTLYFLLFKRDIFHFNSRKGLIYGVLAGITGSVFADLFVVMGLQKSSGINWSILYLLSGPITFSISMALLGEKGNIRKWIAMVVSIIGAFLIIYKPGIVFNLNSGDLLFVSAAIMFALSNITSQKAMEKMSVYQLVFIRTCVPVLFLGILMVILRVPFSLSLTNTGFVIFTGLNMIIGITLVNITIQKAGASFFTIMTNLVPFFVAIFSILIIKEYPSLWQIIGGVMVIGSIFLFERKK